MADLDKIDTVLPTPGFWLHIFRPKQAKAMQEAWLDQHERAIMRSRFRRYLREAKGHIARLEHLLEPERRVEWQAELAQWQAHLDSLETDGVYAIPKGQD